MTSPFVLSQQADSFAWLASLPDECVDHVITDPPYSEHCHANMTSGTAMRKVVNGELARGGIPKVEMPFEPLRTYEWCRDLVRVARRWALSFCTMEDLGRFDMLLGRKQYVRSGVWYKPNSMGQLTGDRPAAAYEGIAIMHREGSKRWNGRGSYGIWRCNGTRGKKDRHPNEKPLDLCLMLIAKFTDRGETILDPFAGSGAIGEACMLLGRRYIGADKDPEWIAKSHARLTAASAAFGSVSDDVAKALCAMKAGASEVDASTPSE